MATAGTEAVAAARAGDIEPDVRFGTVSAVQEAATRGLDVALLAVESVVSDHADELRAQNISYEVSDADSDS